MRLLGAMERGPIHLYTPLLVLYPDDLEGLLCTAPNALFGAVLRLNCDPRYHNSLNAVVIAELVQQLQHREPPAQEPAC